MKYLVINKGPKAGVSLAETPLSALQTLKEWLAAKRADGTADFFYGFVTTGGISIWNANSHEEVMRILRLSPGWPFNDFEIHALCDIDQAVDVMIEARQQLDK
jgi:hypothetical protein